MSIKTFLGFILCLNLAALTGCTTIEDIYTGKTFYTRHNFKYEKGRHLTTNYLRGALVPVNTEVKIIEHNSNVIVLNLVKSGQQVKIVNVFNFSQTTIKQIFKRMFSEKKTNLGKINEKLRKNIKLGIATPGMTKEQILITLGYPPGHRTPSTEMDQWRYWKSRMNTILLYFENDKLSRIRD